MNINSLFNKIKSVGTLPSGKIPMMTPEVNPYGGANNIHTKATQNAKSLVTQGKQSFGNYLKREKKFLVKKRTPKDILQMLTPPIGAVEKVGAGVVKGVAKEVAPVARDALSSISSGVNTVSDILRGTRSNTIKDIVKTHPNIKLKVDVPAKTVSGAKVDIPKGEKLTPYEMKGGKVLLQDGKPYLVSKNQFANIKGNSVVGEAKPLAPELKGTVEKIKQLNPNANLQDKKVELELKSAQARDKGNIKLADKYLKQSENVDTLFGKTKYSQYTLANGKNYKEILTQAPQNIAPVIKKVKFGYYQAYVDGKPTGTLFDTKLQAKQSLDHSLSQAGLTYQSPHWNESNVLSHLRINDRTYKGQKVTFMEELQSDWAKAFRSGETKSNNPLLKNWQEWSIKRALQDAVANKSKYFSWINGAQTSARYDLATHLDNVKWGKSADKGFTNTILKTKNGDEISIKTNEKGIIRYSSTSDWKNKSLDQVIGKGLADKIMSKDTGALSGKGLAFGGEWAHNLYDKQVPNIVKKLTGADVIKMDMGLPASEKTTQWRVSIDIGKGSTPLTPKRLRVGELIWKGAVSKSDQHIITDVLVDGEFKAVPKRNFVLFKDLTVKKIQKRNFRLYGQKMSNEKAKIELEANLQARTFELPRDTTQQGIKITPDVIAKIKGIAPTINTSGKMFGKTTIGTLLAGAGTTGIVAGMAQPSVTVINNKPKKIQFPKMSSNKWDSVGGVIFGEATASLKDMIAIASTIYNRLKNPHNAGKNPYDIITQKGSAGYQYNAFGQKQFNIYKSGKFDVLGAAKAKLVKQIIDEMRNGTFKSTNNATGFHYVNGKTLILDHKPLFSFIPKLFPNTYKAPQNIHNIAQDTASIAIAKGKKSFGDYLKGELAFISKKRTPRQILEMLQPPIGAVEKVGANIAESTAKSVADIVAGKGTQLERQFITRVKKLVPEAQGLKGAITSRNTEALVAKADSIISKDPAKAMNMAKKGTSDLSVAVASRLIDNFTGQAKLATSEVVKTELYSKVSEIANIAAKNLTENGRAIQAATILGKQSPEGMLRWTAGEIQKYNEQAGTRTLRNFLGGAKKIPNLTPVQSKFIVDSMTKIEGMANKDMKAQAFSDLQNKIKSWIPSSLYDKVISVWKAGLLTGIKTSGLNILSNTAHGISEVAKDIPGALVDRMVSLFTGKRTLVATTRGVAPGLKEGVIKGWRFFKTGYDERNSLGKLDYKKINFGKGKVARGIQTYVDKVFTILGSEDQPFFYGARTHSLTSQAMAVAKNEGLKGAEFTKRVNSIVSNPNEKMLEYAVLDAQTAVFQQRTELGKVARSIQKAPGGQVVLPFGKTPSAVATQIINYSPIGIVKTIVENIGKGRFDQRLFSQGIGRGITGVGALYIGGSLFDAGLMTGPRPTNSAQKKLWEIQGKQPYSIYYAGQWRNLGTLGPLGMVLGVGGAMRQGFNQNGSFIGGLGVALGAVGGTLTQQTFLYGINQAINALNQPAQYGPRFIRNLIGSAIPTIVADVARATDPYQRKAGTVGQRIASRLPGLREVLPKRVDALGKPEKSANFFTTMLDATRPYAPTQNLADPVVKELIRLDKAGYNATPSVIGGNNGFKTLTPHQNSRLSMNAGTLAKQAIANIIKDPTYNMLDNEQKAKIIAKVVRPTKDKARGQAIYNATKDLSGIQLSNELNKMSANKLLTKYTYAWYYHFGGRGGYPIIKR